MPRPRRSSAVLGAHPAAPQIFGHILQADDGATQSGVPHRRLLETDGSRDQAILGIREMLQRHHASPEALERTRIQREAIERLGLGDRLAQLGRYPRTDTTRKGNLAEVVLAEYVVATCGVTLPIYRLRYNPNVDQSMKGDDVLAFDLDADPVRVIVGEAKFRGTPTASAVEEIVAGLVRSQGLGIPASLQFVADRLFETNQPDVGRRVMSCGTLFAQDRLRLDYVGLLLSNTGSALKVDASTPPCTRRLAMISLGVEHPDGLVTTCYEGLE